jgi:hypothetical protein
MVEEVPNASHPDLEVGRRRSTAARCVRAVPGFMHRQWKATAVAAILLVGAGWVLGSSSDNPTARASMPQLRSVTTPNVAPAQSHQAATTTTSVVTPVVTPPPAVVTTPVTTPPTTITPVTAAPAPVVVVAAPSVAAPSVAALVSEVEASGIDPGSNWSWSMGDTATHCGAMTGAGTGCTYGSAGLEYSVFSGSPTLALVAHELANAETQNDAVPSLLSQVAAAAGATTWSPTDGVASCLVEYFMGFQDDVAGTWQCPAALASTVAADIHESL